MDTQTTPPDDVKALQRQIKDRDSDMQEVTTRYDKSKDPDELSGRAKPC